MSDQFPDWDDLKPYAEKVINQYQYTAEWDPGHMRQAIQNIADGWGYRVAEDNTGIDKSIIHKNFHRALDEWKKSYPEKAAELGLIA